MAEEVTKNRRHQDLYKKHRPVRFRDLVGQPQAVSQMEQWLKDGRVPNAVLLTGPSGVGKTTAARILVRRLGCSSFDCQEINAAESRGIDTIRDMGERMHLAPLGGGGARVWIIDECQKLTGDAQSSALKMLEDGPEHAHFFLCTTDPQKLLKTIVTRCTELKFRALDEAELLVVQKRVLDEEGVNVLPPVLKKIAECAEGSARKAVVLLQQVMGLESEDEQLAAVEKADSRRQAIELARALMDPKTQWSRVADVLKNLDDEPESLRRMILGYYQSVLLGGGIKANRAAELISRFQYNVFDSGKPGLTLMCYESLRGGK